MVGPAVAVGRLGTRVGVSVGVWACNATGVINIFGLFGSAADWAQATSANERINRLAKTVAFFIIEPMKWRCERQLLPTSDFIGRSNSETWCSPVVSWG